MSSGGATWARPRGVGHVVESWLASGQVRPCLTADRSLDAQGASYGRFPRLPDGSALPNGALQALQARGVERLYSHQTVAIEAALAGRHVLIATPTASGKSLCFHLPVVSRLSTDPGATALFLYPTKALSRDQEQGLGEMLGESGLGIPSIVFDGDTPGDVRKKARERGRIVLSNPDMLHAGILPNHTRWASFFRGLRYVVLDELHTYRGVFGSHMAHVIARLRRVARFYGSEPTFIGATATIGNPLELGAKLLGVDEDSIELVSESGAPSARRRAFIYNPPVVDAELGVRASTLKAAVRLAADLILARVPTIVFGGSRSSVEVMLKYLRSAVASELRSSYIDPKTAIMGYRGGYLPAMRRDIESGLRSGSILGVVATNALELGIDIGDLDAVVCAGYPGSVAGTWQRFGRAGRRGKDAALVLVCSSSAVDQYLAREPSYLLDGGAEHALVDPSNPEVLVQHLKCALFEAPFSLPSEKDAEGDVIEARARPTAGTPPHDSGAPPLGYACLDAENTRDALEYLAKSQLAHVTRGEAVDRYYYVGEPFPASHVSLRNIGWDNFVIVDQGTDQEPTERTIGELDYRAAHTMLHEQAIYQQDAEQYQVERLDFDNHKAFVKKVQPDYFTTALTHRKVELLDVHIERKRGALCEGLGDVKVVEKVTGYKKIKFFTHENSGYGDVHLPPMEMHTTSYFVSVPRSVWQSLGAPALVTGALAGVGHALETTAALALMCDPRDINRSLAGSDQPLEPTLDAEGHPPTLYLFDAHPGGVGLAERIFERARELFERALVLMERCPCASGCPACVGPVDESPRAAASFAPGAATDGTASHRKALALRLLRALLDEMMVSLH